MTAQERMKAVGINIENANSKFAKIKKALLHPLWGLGAWLKRHPSIIKDDEFYIKLDFRLNMGYWPDLNNPKTFNEKLEWSKLHNIHPEYTEMVDKYGAKQYVQRALGTDENIIPTLGAWNTFDEIDFDQLPNQFVLKVTHDSGGVVIVKDKSNFDKKKARHKLKYALSKTSWLNHREYPYRDVPRRIIAEKYMVDESGTELKDYKFFCFNGEPKMLFIATDRGIDTRFDYFDIDFNHLPFAQGHPWADKEIVKPKNYEKMVDIARKLSQGISHVRVDLYNVNGEIYFGELTFFHFSGCTPIVPFEWDEKIGSWWQLPEK